VRVLAFFLNDCEHGRILRGAERRFFEVSTCLKKLGAKIFALEYESLHSEKWGKPGYVPVRIKRWFAGHSILSALRAMIHGIKICLVHHCDIVYVTGRISGVGGLWVGLIAPYIVSCLCRKPLMIIFHHVEPNDLREKNPLAMRAYRKGTCLAVSQATSSDVKECFNVRRILVVGNGVSSKLFKTVTHERKAYDCVFLGRVAEGKGVLDLMNAWKAVVAKHPSSQLLLVGGVEKNIEGKLYRTIRQLQLRRNVIVSGFVPDEKAARLLNSSNIFVLPSHREGSGLVVAEAMAAGLPCIISDLPALREYYESAAVFVPPNDAQRLAQAILFLLLNPEQCRELKKKGQALARSLSWKKVAMKEFEALKNACNA